MKGLSIAIGAYQATFWRVVIGTSMSALLFLALRLPRPSRAAMRLHVIRGAVNAIMAILFFWGIARVPLAEAIALSFIAPLIALYLAAPMLGEMVGRQAIFGSVLGLAGVGIILAGRATGHYGPEALPGALAILASACFYAFNLILQRKQAQVASPVEVALFQNLAMGCCLSLGAPFLASVPPAHFWPLLALAAFLAILSLLVLSWAYARAEAPSLIAVEYTAFGWAALFGWLFYREALSWAVLAGTSLIVLGCVIAARGSRVAEEAQLEMA